jgi:hypothetical protein
MDERKGLVGTITSPLLALVGFLTDHAKELQAISFAASIVIAGFVIPWWVRKWYRVLFGHEKSRPQDD